VFGVPGDYVLGFYDQLQRSFGDDGIWYEGTMAYQNCFFLLTANHGYERRSEPERRAVLHRDTGVL
jgi:TPP-dependent 2-oxoacid decarboxylase